eukprot:CAMPEP_0197448162 /NCGR_PEP_ID=MMETSP1175-20131217/16393_1 /TAXON_ID=1003142 /ORGANISM="Triceratium dubium, Strain CCMP147" /LENGTH=82 /DNA_ID=CAMNT_0042979807 /DNA_START=394 /DNA_END=642 /DNA_ORIENTATION=+
MRVAVRAGPVEGAIFPLPDVATAINKVVCASAVSSIPGELALVPVLALVRHMTCSAPFPELVSQAAVHAVIHHNHGGALPPS